MKVIKRNYIMCMVVCVAVLMLSSGMTQMPIAFAATNSIIAYGQEAEIFASILSTDTAINDNTRSNPSTVIVLSDTNLVNRQSIENSIKNGAILVAINLPADNGFVDVPTIQEEATVTLYNLNDTARNAGGNVISETSREIVPPYWITVVKQTTPALTENCMTLTDDTEAHEATMQLALNAVTEALCPTPNTPNRGNTGGEYWIKRDEKADTVLFDTDQRSGYQVRHKVYQLDIWDHVTNKEYWQVETYIDSWIGTYISEPWHCGPYLTQRSTRVESNAPLYEYDPTTTDNTYTTAIDIQFGVDVGSGGPTGGVSIGHSDSWTRDGAVFSVMRYGLNNIRWFEDFRSANWDYYPFSFIEPAPASHFAAASTTRAIYNPAVGAGITLSFTEDNFALVNDYIVTIGFVMYLYQNQYGWSFPGWSNLSYASKF